MNQGQQYQPQPVYYQSPPIDKKKVFGIIIAAIFGLCAIFELIAMIGMGTVDGISVGPVFIISGVFIILGCAGIAVAPFIRTVGKRLIMISGTVLAAGYLGNTMTMFGFSGVFGVAAGRSFTSIEYEGSFGCYLVAVGYIVLALVCYFGFTDNKAVRYLFFVPAVLVFIGSLVNWISMEYFSVMADRVSALYFIFDFIITLFLLAGTVILGLYLVIRLGEKPVRRPKPVYAQPQQPQQ